MTPGRGKTQERIDVLLVDRGLVPSRAKAQALILAGQVSSGGVRLEKAGIRVPVDAPLEIRPGRRFVSRGGHKLEAALRDFRIQVTGRDALDVGASTGGFTQVLLEAGAERVLALDVGRGQLDWSLRRDPRVHPLEGINARHLRPTDLPFPPSLAVVDVSFISLKLVLPAVAPCLTAEGEIVALVKPQFEVGRGKVGRGGIVRDPDDRRTVLEDLTQWSCSAGLGPAGLVRSALKGAEGNQEYFLLLKPSDRGLNAEDRVRNIDSVFVPDEETDS